MNTQASTPRVISLNEQEIFDDRAFIEALNDLATSAQRRRTEVVDYAKKCLEELAVRPDERYLDRVAKLARFMYTRSYEPGLDVNVEQLERLKELARHQPLVFLWSHKSHLDSFVFMRAIYDSNFRPQPLSFAGINMAFTGFGTLAKRSGAIFLRRSFKDDAIYKLVFKHYIDYLVSKRVPLSWSIEGTRSRTGKLMPPKLGLIQWVIESYQRASCDDALLIPVSISFDQIAEMDDYVAMQQGLPKRKESLSWFIGYITGMKARNGKIYVRFAEPVALSDSTAVSDAVFSTGSSSQQIQVQKIAFEVCSRIEHVTPVTITDLVTMVLLAANERALTEQQIRDHARQIVTLVHRRALPTASDLLFDSGEGLVARMTAMCDTGLLDCYSDTRTPVYRIAPGKQLAAAYYRNTIIHYFVSSAIAELGLAAMPGSSSSADDFWDSISTLRDLLKFEFFFKTKGEFRADIDAYLEFRYPGWRGHAEAGQALSDVLFRENAPLFGHSILRTFIESYGVMSEALLDKAGYPVLESGEAQLLKDCLTLGREMLLRKKIASEASLSEPLFATATRLARHRGLLTGEPAELGQKRTAFAAEMGALIKAVNVLQHYYDQQQELTCDS
ncbi:MAG: 1-acyl-sn-glycerol-3-phosphate acyltransferase [Woeseiaceae bacterium]